MNEMYGDHQGDDSKYGKFYRKIYLSICLGKLLLFDLIIDAEGVKHVFSQHAEGYAKMVVFA